MLFTAQLDINVVAHEADDEVNVMLDLVAPSAPQTSEERVGTSLQIVLDRSGSMAGEPLQGAVQALGDLVGRLDARDNFGVVVFDDTATVAVPAGPLVDKDRVLAQLAAIGSGGTTDLSGGYLRGLQEVRRVVGDGGGTLLIISDGHANAGITDPDRVGGLASKAVADGIVTSTLGYGLGYDEVLLSAIARGGSGSHHFAQDPDTAGALIASEVDNLLAKTVQAVSLTVRFSPLVELLQLYNDLPSAQVGEGEVMIDVGDFYADEARKLLMRFKVPAMAALGAAQVATLELRYVELPALREQVVTIPISVNVVPGDEAAGRVPDPTVRTEVLFQAAQQSKRRASEALTRGDRTTAKKLLDDALDTLRFAGDAAPATLRAELETEAADLTFLTEHASTGDVRLAAKMSRESFHRQNRKRGRGRSGREAS